MSALTFPCTNPQCRRSLTFDTSLAGTIQYCTHCGQRLIVPDAGGAATAVLATEVVQPIAQQAIVQTPTPVVAPRMANQAQERSIETQTARKLNMGSGCLAMVAVMFAVAIMGAGIGTIANVASQQLWAWAAIIAGPAGVAAFVFFGYIATETASSSRDRENR